VGRRASAVSPSMTAASLRVPSMLVVASLM